MLPPGMQAPPHKHTAPKRTAFDGAAFYQAECMKCNHHTFLTEDDVLEGVGKIAKKALDKGDSTALTLALMNFAAENGGNVPSVTCKECSEEINLSKFVRKNMSVDNAVATNKTGGFSDMTTAAEVVKLIEDVEFAPEQDPLWLALMKVRRDQPGHNHWHGETGTMRISSTLRWLIKPTMSFIRNVLFRGFDTEFIGSVTVFRATANQRKAAASSWFKAQFLKMFPISLAADMPVSCLVSILVWYLFCNCTLIIHFLCAHKTEQQLEHEEGLFLQLTTMAGIWYTLEVAARYFSFVTFPAACTINLFLYWSSVRDPGYMLPSEERRRDMMRFVETKGQCEEDNEDEQKKEKLDELHHSDENTVADFSMIAQALGVAAAVPAAAGVAALAGAAGAGSPVFSPHHKNNDDDDGNDGGCVPQPMAMFETAMQKKNKNDEHDDSLQTATAAAAAAEQQARIDDATQHPKATEFMKTMGDDAGEEPSYCKQCQIHRPARTYHCKVCNLCVMEHDHHCVVIGACVGKRNTRVFYGFLVTATSGTFVNLIQNWVFVISTNNEVSKLAWILLWIMTPISIALVGWIGSLWARHSHGFKTNRTAREMVKLAIKIKKKEVKMDTYLCWPGNPPRPVAQENWEGIRQRPIETSVFATSDSISV